MKMFYFNPNTYGEEYFVVATRSSEALLYLKNYLYKAYQKEKENNKRTGRVYCSYQGIYEIWQQCTIHTLPDGYTIDEYLEGEVLQSELA
jgi:hypothetical protein